MYEIDANPPSSQSEDGSEPEVWTCVTHFSEEVAESERELTLASVIMPLAFIDRMAPTGFDTMAFRVTGQMDEAAAEAAQTLSTIIGAMIQSEIDEVSLISHRDALAVSDEAGRIPSFSITRSVLALLKPQ